MAAAWDEVCDLYDIKGIYIGTRQIGDVGEQLANLENVIAAGGGDGVALVITDSTVLDAPARKLIKMGVPVIAVNNADTRPENERIPYLRYVGESSYDTGRANAQMVFDKFRELAGRPPKRALYLNQAPGVWALETRGRGMADVATAEGAKFDRLVVSYDPTQLREAVRAYVERNPDAWAPSVIR